MNKNITTIISGDKTKPFTDIKPFYMTCHFFWCYSLTYRKTQNIYKFRIIQELTSFAQNIVEVLFTYFSSFVY
jgi:hypothetical protein